MRDFLKQLYANIGNLNKSIVSVLTMCLFSSFKAAYRLERMEKSQGKRMFVLGNGPSLKEILNNEDRINEILLGDSIVMNYFANSEVFKVVKPRYYILLDPTFYKEDIINNNPKISQVFENLQDVDWEMTLFMVYVRNANVIHKYVNNPRINIVFYNGTKIIGFEWLQNICYKHNLGIPSSRNVIIPALQLMINIGYKDIILYGAEFSWTKTIDVNPENNRVFLNDCHFYTNKDVHYYEKGWYKWYLKAIVDMLDGMDNVAKYAKSRKVSVINRTRGSFVDSFEYENPDTIVS